MKVWYSTDHSSFWPVGCASVVVAESIEEARQLLDYALLDEGLTGSIDHPYTLIEVPLNKPAAYVLNTGNY